MILHNQGNFHYWRILFYIQKVWDEASRNIQWYMYKEFYVLSAEELAIRKFIYQNWIAT